MRLKIPLSNLKNRMMMKIIPLKKEFVGRGESKGLKLTLKSKTNWGYLYEVNTKHIIYYEVFKKRLNHRFGCVSYPTSSAFGIWAWTTPHLERAYVILESFTDKQSIKKGLNETKSCSGDEVEFKSFYIQNI